MNTLMTNEVTPVAPFNHERNDMINLIERLEAEKAEKAELVKALRSVRSTAIIYARGKIMDEVGHQLAAEVKEVTTGVYSILYPTKA